MGKQWAFAKMIKKRNPQIQSTKGFAGIKNGASNGTEALKRCVDVFSVKSAQVLAIKTGKKITRIPMENIMYIEVENKVCHVYTEDCVYTASASLNSLFEYLDNELFMRAQKSYAVNMNFIEYFYYDRIIMRGGREITLSRNNRAELKNQYQQFLFGQVRSGKV